VSRRSRIWGFGSAASLLVLGVAAAAAVRGTVGGLLATVLVGLGLVLAVALVFLEVGLTEDRERAREERAREAERQAAARKQAPLRPRSLRPLERMRGSRRRLK
jgi:hypothetical protein